MGIVEVVIVSKRMRRCEKREIRRVEVMVPFLMFVLMAVPCVSLAADATLSDEYSMELNPSARQKIGEAEYQLLMDYFHEAERAIESKNLEGLMTLYSERYSNRKGNKKFAEEVWSKIFANFNDLSAKHSMELLTYDTSGAQPMAVLECSGLLTGIPKGADQPVTIDSWDKQWHVLINEGSWRLFGNSGKSEQRYGADDYASHPLF